MGQEYLDTINSLDTLARTAYQKFQQQPDGWDAFNFLTILIYVEDMYDKILRGEALHAAQSAGLDSREELNRVTQNMDRIRHEIRSIVESHDFDEKLVARSQQLSNNWLKRSVPRKFAIIELVEEKI